MTDTDTTDTEATEPEHPARILIVCAHPDDVDFGAGGSVAVWTRAGVEVTYCMITSGQAGSEDRTLSVEDIAAIRIEEQTAAAKVMGVTDLIWLGYPDGALEPTIELRRDLSRVIRQVRPDRVVTQSPQLTLDRIYASHPDHLAAGTATIAAVYPDARNPRSHPELLDEGHEPHAVDEIWIMGGAGANESSRMIIDTTDVIDLKVEALRAHVTQTGHRVDLAEMIRAWGEATAKEVGLPEGRSAEVFRRVDTR